MPKIIKLVKKQDTPGDAPSLSEGVISDSGNQISEDSKIPRFQNANTPSHHFLLTCQSGLESLVKRECEKLGCGDIHALDRLVESTGTMKHLYELMLWSRFANRVYLSLARESVTDFDTLHAVLRGVPWGEYLTGKEQIVVEASSTRSTLSSIPTIQSVGQNAIFSTITTPNYTTNTEVHILILIIDDRAHILLDVTGDPLHKRGYRRDAGEAPLKENLAAALVAFASWKYRTPLLDPFCGSGTIPIEAALMARNIAPGLFRTFRIEELPFHDAPLLETVRAEAEKKIYPSGDYSISGKDIDPEMIRIAEGNARRAGVAGDITFSTGDYLVSNPLEKGGSRNEMKAGGLEQSENQSSALSGTSFLKEVSATLITNPPYGNRLQSEDLSDIYKKLIQEVSLHGGGFITSYPVDVRFGLANRKLLNGGEECRFWYKKNEGKTR